MEVMMPYCNYFKAICLNLFQRTLEIGQKNLNEAAIIWVEASVLFNKKEAFRIWSLDFISITQGWV
jgi:hypothetical protein